MSFFYFYLEVVLRVALPSVRTDGETVAAHTCTSYRLPLFIQYCWCVCVSKCKVRCVATARALFPSPGKARCHVWGWEGTRKGVLKIVSRGAAVRGPHLKIFLPEDIGFWVQPKISLDTWYPELLLTMLLPRTLDRSRLSLFGYALCASNVDGRDLSLGVGASESYHVVSLARAGDAAAGRSGRPKLRADFVQGNFCRLR